MVIMTAREKRERFNSLIEALREKLAPFSEKVVGEDIFSIGLIEKIEEIIYRLGEIFSKCNQKFQLGRTFKVQDFIDGLLLFEKGVILAAGPADLTYINCRIERIAEEWSA
jgi:hypothetical protein